MTNPELMGQNIILTALTDVHYATLQAITLSNADVYRYTTVGTSMPDVARWFSKAQTENAWTVIRLSDNTPIGSTRLYHFDERSGAVTMGYTWYAPDCHSSGTVT